MSAAERQQRSRWLRTLFNQMFGKRRDAFYAKQRWLREGEAKYVAFSLADCFFNCKTKTADYARWNLINEHVLDRLVEMEGDFRDDKPRRSKA